MINSFKRLTDSLDLKDSEHSWSLTGFFKSGDLGFYHPDGTIEFVARKDTQVKIRGLRVELDEVAHHIRQSLEAVQKIIVDVLKTSSGVNLAVYLCFSNETRLPQEVFGDDDDLLLPHTQELQQRLTEMVSRLTAVLPRYMIPTFSGPLGPAIEKAMSQFEGGAQGRAPAHSLFSSLFFVIGNLKYAFPLQPKLPRGGLMTISVKQPGSYISKQVFHIPQHVDLDNFKTAWERTVQLCSNLRTRIILHQNSSIQMIVKYDRGDMGYGSRLYRAALVQEPNGQNFFCLLMHHAIFDGWTMSIMLRTLVSFYQQSQALTVYPYNRFVKYTQDLDQNEATRFWQDQLQDAQKASFPDPAENLNVQKQTKVFQKHLEISWPKDTSVTKASVLRAAWAVVLSRYCTSDDICFGAVVSGRNASVSGIEGVTGSHYSNCPSSYLYFLGVRPEIMVPFCFEKSPWAIIAMLGIMKAGGAFVPLDPGHPFDRRKSLVQEVNARIVLVSPSTAQACEGIAELVIEISEQFLSHLKVLDISLQPPKTISSPDNAAYTLFTSGQLGSQRRISMGSSSSSRWFQFANYIFDACISEIWGPLIQGGVVCVPTDRERLHDAANFITSSQSNIGVLTPSFVKTLSPLAVPSLKTLNLGGEAPTKDLLDTWFEHVDLRNAYGPTEACISCAYYQYKSPNESPTIIGNGFVHNTWIVDPENHNHLAPIGCIGELLVQGWSLARGYIGDGEKTKASFVNDVDWIPHAVPGHEFGSYKTGISPSTTRMAQFPTWAVKTLSHDESHENDDVQTIQVTGKTQLISDTLINLYSKLASQLPEYMIPQYLIPVARIPQNSAGKARSQVSSHISSSHVHRGPVEMVSQSSLPFRECRTDIQRWLRDQWAMVLAMPATTISVDDNFYNLGGDSIRIVTLNKLISEKFNVQLGISLLNSKQTTIGIMATYIEDAREERLANKTSLSVADEITTVTNASWARHPQRISGHRNFTPASPLGRYQTVIVLVRSKSSRMGLERVKDAARITGWWRDNDKDKIEVWTGDLSQPHLGLEESQWSQLTKSGDGQVDAFIHNGAVVNWNADYTKLKAANVDSTVDLLHLASVSASNPKFVFVTGGIQVSHDDEVDVHAPIINSLNGYIQTKFVAERVVYSMSQKLPSQQNRISIVMPGRIIGGASTGVANVDDFLWRMVSCAAAMRNILPILKDSGCKSRMCPLWQKESLVRFLLRARSHLMSQQQA
ncbi:unnamed protein product [Clonostachys rosea f. rosea IK726]|uniref:Uncharacterized protein n=1 Tax=Clonostachys rosea f. rosea IK726 TaxID=1349383 RepID=A0ACA9UBT5_BIOOC|nr:unnamed protein product [Clonostachys rosea f. rosea IK726]